MVDYSNSLKQIIENGPNKFARVLGHATVDGEPVSVRVAVRGFYHARAEYRSLVNEHDIWHAIGGNFSLSIQFRWFLRAIPVIAQFEIISDLMESEPEIPAVDFDATEVR